MILDLNILNQSNELHLNVKKSKIRKMRTISTYIFFILKHLSQISIQQFYYLHKINNDKNISFNHQYWPLNHYNTVLDTPLQMNIYT